MELLTARVESELVARGHSQGEARAAARTAVSVLHGDLVTIAPRCIAAMRMARASRAPLALPPGAPTEPVPVADYDYVAMVNCGLAPEWKSTATQ